MCNPCNPKHETRTKFIALTTVTQINEIVTNEGEWKGGRERNVWNSIWNTALGLHLQIKHNEEMNGKWEIAEFVINFLLLSAPNV